MPLQAQHSSADYVAPVLLRLPAVMRVTGLGRSTIYRLVSDGEFPRPVHLALRAVGWRKTDIDTWFAERIPVDRPARPRRLDRSAERALAGLHAMSATSTPNTREPAAPRHGGSARGWRSRARAGGSTGDDGRSVRTARRSRGGRRIGGAAGPGCTRRYGESAPSRQDDAAPSGRPRLPSREACSRVRTVPRHVCGAVGRREPAACGFARSAGGTSRTDAFDRSAGGHRHGPPRLDAIGRFQRAGANGRASCGTGFAVQRCAPAPERALGVPGWHRRDFCSIR